MNPERWQKIKHILENALEIAPASRAEYLGEACGADTELRREIELLLEFETPRTDVFERGALESVLGADSFAENRIGRELGPYRITAELGAGGMGAVYLVERADGEFTQTAALKLIKRGMDSENVLRRFYNERQILASLEHPNIARLVDGGTTADGLPFFVMEYVEGRTILEYANEENLALEERLGLFRQICAAVSFAHRNLVIHRDLKPSNILVTAAGEIKLLDFGIAKLLKSDDANQTATQMPVFTPEYASPEQIRGEKLTTATDVYSLGVLLYELLTGAHPYPTAGRSISEIIKAVCETEPVFPSRVRREGEKRRRGEEEKRRGGEGEKIEAETDSVEADTDSVKAESSSAATRQRVSSSPLLLFSSSPLPLFSSSPLKGDLDNIILQALRKEPERRYSSVEQLSEDIRRHLGGLPVSASRDTWGYRASKFLRRNKIAAAAAALVLITLIGGLAATLYQRNKAQRRFNDVRQLANSFLFEFHDAIENLPGSIPARELVVRRALEYLDQLSAEAGGDPQLQRELATAYEKIGKIQGNTYFSNLGDTDGAMKSYRRSLEIRLNLIKDDPANRELRHELANSYEGVADMLYTANELEKGLEHYEKALEIRVTLAAAEPQNLNYTYALAEGRRRVADISGLDGYPNLGDTKRALENYREAVALGEGLIAAEPENKAYQASYATWLVNLAMLESVVGENEKAVADGLRAIAVLERIGVLDGNNETQKLNLLSAYNVIRSPLSEEMRFDEAKGYMRRTIEILREMSAADPKNSFLRRSLGVSYNSLGRIETDAGETRAAVGEHQKVLKIVEELIAADPNNGENLRDLALTLEFLGNSQMKSGDCQAALPTYRRALEAYGKSAGPAEDMAAVHTGIGRCLAATGSLDKAAQTFRDALAAAEQGARKSPLNVKKQTRLAGYYLEGGKVFAALGRKNANASENLREAREWLEKAARIFDGLKSTDRLSRLNAAAATETEQELKKLN
ncbi:MAG: protein kinase [Acidobacteria bacterium]|nr:protein kinase [Acidobacteriota bacterium]